MKRIDFPENEKKAIMQRLNTSDNAFTVKPSLQFRRGEMLETSWGAVLQIIDLKKINGITELREKYMLYPETMMRSPETIWGVEDCDKIDILELKKIR